MRMTSMHIHSVEVVGALHEFAVLLSPLRQAVSELFSHAIRVLAMVDWVAEPRDSELQLALAGLDVLWLIRIPRLHPVTVQGDPDLSAILLLELLAIYLHSCTMSDQDVVSNRPCLPRAVTNRALLPVTGMTRRKLSNAISKHRATPGLIVRDPELDLRSHRLENEPRVVDEILHVLLFVQESTVAVMQTLRQIPVEKRYHWLDIVGQELVHQVHVVLQAFLIDRIIAAAEGNDAGP